MKKSKGFTLAEIMIVMSLILLFVIVFQNLFKPKNMHIYYGQKCVNDLYGIINTFINEGLTSKGFNSGSTTIYPTGYLVKFNYTENSIINSIISKERTSNLSGEINSQICYINEIYNVILSGNLGQIKVTKGSNNNQFELLKTDGTTIITGKANILLCKNNNTECGNIGEYIVDKRSQTVIKRVCLSFIGTTCGLWNQNQ